jgi:hypothetical protein
MSTNFSTRPENGQRQLTMSSRDVGECLSSRGFNADDITSTLEACH